MTDLVTPVDVHAAGAVLWRRDPAGLQVAVVHRPRYDDWSLPKGKLGAGESMPAAAVREVAEETGSAARLGAMLGEVSYRVPEGHKLVRYWAAEAMHGGFTPNDETDELRWLAPPRAAEILSYTHDVAVLARFTAVGVPAAMLLLVRHAKAGSRTAWRGDDVARPLSAPGREQARALAGMLALFGPDRIRSAPPLRCRETVEPVAAVLAGRVELAADARAVGEEPLFAEDGYWDDPAAGLARFHALAALPGVTLVASQGGVIPDLVGKLVRAAGPSLADVDPDRITSRKASTWALGMRDGVLVSADYYPRPTG